MAQGLKILLADADAAARARNAAELRELGLEVSEAADGQSVLDAYAQARPDLVIVDLDLPDISGFALTRILRQRAFPDWQPVIVLGAAADEEAVLQAYEAGADAFIRKTVSPRLLHARLRPIVRSLMMQRESLARERELQRRSEAEEAEKRLAQHLMTRLINADKLNDPALECWVSPAQTLSGDLVAAARTPGGVLHVLLADGTGHGLAASLNVLPITAPFYRMTERGFGIGAIARELNAKLREMMPVDRFVAATLAAIDFREQVVQVWNGGNPMAWLLGPNGHAECMFASNRVPLGLIEDEDFDETVESCVLQAGSQLVLYSDGLIEAEDAAGEVFGEERLALLLGEAPLQERLGRVKEGLSSHLSGCGAHDDVSLVLVKFDAADTQPRALAAAPRRRAPGASACAWGRPNCERWTSCRCCSARSTTSSPCARMPGRCSSSCPSSTTTRSTMACCSSPPPSSARRTAWTAISSCVGAAWRSSPPAASRSRSSTARTTRASGWRSSAATAGRASTTRRPGTTTARAPAPPADAASPWCARSAKSWLIPAAATRRGRSTGWTPRRHESGQ